MKKPRRMAGLLGFRRAYQPLTEERGATGLASLEMVTSTRRFMARPELVPLLATGVTLRRGVDFQPHLRRIKESLVPTRYPLDEDN